MITELWETRMSSTVVTVISTLPAMLVAALAFEAMTGSAAQSQKRTKVRINPIGLNPINFKAL